MRFETARESGREPGRRRRHRQRRAEIERLRTEIGEVEVEVDEAWLPRPGLDVDAWEGETP